MYFNVITLSVEQNSNKLGENTQMDKEKKNAVIDDVNFCEAH